ncbi:hypothetical protein [Thiothrix subterranea]|uniref:Uncharacterized protein n=1 Tax=Thiothrix subterranea TaxID=2735563 RepID=A0ABU0Y367_9GAMM|nr:hypothetical protein [Thiothrix subterranea]MDQ5767235.1 hypothetical protein [Thiothrix subterranea]
MKWVLAPLLLLAAITVSADDAYQRGYQMGADSKAFQEGWDAAQKKAVPAQQQPSVASEDDLKAIFSQPFVPSNRFAAPAQGQTQNATEQLLPEWKATFVPENCSRTYYTQESKSFKTDECETSLEFGFIVPENSTQATIRIIGIQTGESDAAVLYQSKEKIIISAINDSSIDRSEIYTLYPKIGIGFLNMTRADAGDNFAKTDSKTDANIPSASSLTFSLRLKE